MKTSRDNSYMVSYNRIGYKFESHYPDILDGSTINKDEYEKTLENVNKIILKTREETKKTWIITIIVILIIFLLMFPTLGMSTFLIFPFYCYALIYIPKKFQEIMEESIDFVRSESERYYEKNGFRIELEYQQELGPVTGSSNGHVRQTTIYIPAIFLTPLKLKENQPQFNNTKEVVISVPQSQDTYMDENELLQIELYQGDGFSKEDAMTLVLERLTKEDLSYLTDDDISKLNISIKGKTILRKMKK